MTAVNLHQSPDRLRLPRCIAHGALATCVLLLASGFHTVVIAADAVVPQAQPLPALAVEGSAPTQADIDQACAAFVQGAYSTTKGILEVKGTTGGSQSLSGSGPGFDPLSSSALLSALQDFIIKKAKQESIYSALLGLKRHIPVEYQKKFFPVTGAYLATLNDNSPGSAIDKVRDAFKQDLDALPEHLMEFIGEHVQDGNEKKYQIDLSCVVIPVVAKIVRGAEPGDAIGDLTKLATVKIPATHPEYGTVNKALIMAGAIARTYQSLQSIPPYQRKISYTLAIQLLEDKTHPEVGRAVIEQMRIVLTAFNCLEDTYKFDPKNADDAKRQDAFEKRYAPAIYRLLTRIEVLRTVCKSSRSHEGKTHEQVLASYVAILDALGEVIVASDDLLPTSDTKVVAALKTVTEDIHKALDIYRAMIGHDYGTVVALGVELAGRFGLTPSSTTGDVAGTIVPGQLPKEFYQWVQIGSALAVAKSTEDIENVLDKTSPIGGYHRKRTAPDWQVHLNAYLGAAYGFEDAPEGIDDGAYAGVAMPVGVEVGHAIPDALYGPSYVGVLATVLDFGNVTNTRLDSTESDHEIEFQQVFAPGAYLVVGITVDYPITLGVGFEKAVHACETADGKATDAWHYGGFLGIDVVIW